VDMLSAYAEAIHRNQLRVDVVGTDQLSDPTPCTDWDVHALIGHIIAGYQMFATACGTAPAAGGTSVTARELAAAHRAAASGALSAFSSPNAMQQIVQLPVGAVPGSVALGLALTDAVVHGWDLAKATGQDLSIEEGLAAMLLAGAQDSIGPDMRQPGGVMPVFAQPIAVAPDRPSGEHLVAFLGREP